jgi:hypothetical protein
MPQNMKRSKLMVRYRTLLREIPSANTKLRALEAKRIKSDVADIIPKINELAHAYCALNKEFYRIRSELWPGTEPVNPSSLREHPWRRR